MTPADFESWCASRREAFDAAPGEATRQQIRAKVREKAKALAAECPAWAATSKIDPACDWSAYVADRLRAHEACSSGAVRAGLRKKLRDLARRIGAQAPTWATQREKRSAATRRSERRKLGGFGEPRPTRDSGGAALAVVPVGAPMRALEIPDALRAWRQRVEGACVQLRGDGRVTLCVPISIDKTERHEFASVDAAIRAVA